MDADTLVRDYLRRLEDAAREADPGQASDLVADIRDHIETALAGAGHADEAAIRSVLDRLGPPEVIVAAAAESLRQAGGRSTRRQGATRGLRRLGPWVLGAVAGIVAVLAWFPMLVSYGFPTPALPLVVPAAALAAVVLRRPGGVAFVASTLGVAGALVIALALSVPLSCPDGEFAATCTGPRLGPMIVPSLGLVTAGMLLARRALRRS
jgi:hypothetical protein